MARQFAFVTVWLWLWSATFPGIASAGIIDTSGAILEIVPPSSVELDALESNSKIFAFTEMLELTLDKDVAVDITSSGFYGEVRDLTPGSIEAKTVVDVYFLHFDPVTGLVNLSGSITFDQDILGVIVLNESLDATDGTLGFPGTAYPTGLNNRGLDFGGVNSDFITLSEDLRTISINWQATRRVDQIRIITAIPGPRVNLYTDPKAFEAALQATNKGAKAGWNFNPHNLPPAVFVTLDDPLNIDTHAANPHDPWTNTLPPPSGNCCVVHRGPGCEDRVCEAAVCAVDSFCCDTAWDRACAEEAQSNPHCDCAPSGVSKWPPALDNVTFQSNIDGPQPPLPNPHGIDGLFFATPGFADNDNNVLGANFHPDSFDIISGPPAGDNHTAMSLEISVAVSKGPGPVFVTVYDKNEVPVGKIELDIVMPPGECPVGGTCAAGFPDCGDPGCGCITRTDGSGFCTGPSPCDDLTLCPLGDADCPPGFVCAIDTCCVDPVCVPACGSVPLAPPPPGTLTTFGIAGSREVTKGKGGALTDLAAGGRTGGVALGEKGGVGGSAFLGIIVKGDLTIGRVNLYDLGGGIEGISQITVYEDCPWDLDGDGSVGILDLLALLAAWFADPGGPPDFDLDGTVDIFDLLTLLANWGPCP